MVKAKKRVRTWKGLRQYTYLGCPLTRNRSAWCYRLCVPDQDGEGQCGRVAPHSLKGEVALSIERHKKNKRSFATHCAMLERMYLSDPCNSPYEVGVRVTDRAAEIVVPLLEWFAGPRGDIYGSVCQKMLGDAAALAVNSIVTDTVIVTASFNVHLPRARATGSLIARGRLLAVSRDQFLAESVIVDSDGEEIGRGTGAFVRSEVSLSTVVADKSIGVR